MLRTLLLYAIVSVGLLVPSLLAQTASDLDATTFSFASDDNHDGPTFVSDSTTTFVNASDSVYDLMVDVNDSVAGGLVTFQSLHTFDALLYDYRVIPCGPGFLHMWKVKGGITFNHFDSASGFPLILSIKFEQALFSSYSPFADTLGETATLQDSASVDGGVTFTAGPMLIGIGVLQPELNESEDFAYTLTNIRRQADKSPFIKLSDNGEILEKWESEGSFSAAADAKE